MWLFNVLYVRNRWHTKYKYCIPQSNLMDECSYGESCRYHVFLSFCLLSFCSGFEQPRVTKRTETTSHAQTRLCEHGTENCVLWTRTTGETHTERDTSLLILSHTTPERTLINTKKLNTHIIANEQYMVYIKVSCYIYII